MLLFALVMIIVFLLAIIGALLWMKLMSPIKVEADATNTPEKVAKFYDQTTDKFLQVYGEIIQAFRTTNVEDYLKYTIQSAGISASMKIIDAGCGVCGPASFIAQQFADVHLSACTISEVQKLLGEKKIAEKNVTDRVKITLGDYHKLDELFENKTYDRVIFLESFGHSNDKTKVIEASWKVLKPGCKLYIKDLFIRESKNDWEQLRINHICGQINGAYEYQIGDLNKVVSAIRKQGFIINFIRPPQIDLSAFEHLAISNDFQNLFNIGKIESWDDYVFPIDFFEILAEKPLHSIEEQKHLYFMNR
jgi:cyclopropane fatty-acyl-phospholipid synthase-like methyltransferase